MIKYSINDLDRMLYKAYLDARKNERNAISALDYELNFEDDLRELRNDLWYRKYTPLPAMCFIVNHPTKREVFAPAFLDRIVSHFLYNILYPLFDPLFIYDSFSCRKGKGTLYGILRFEHHLRSCTNNFTLKAYVLSLDISGYFMSINKIILRLIIKLKMDSHNWDIDYDFINYLLDIVIFKDVVGNCIRLGKNSDWDDLPKHKSMFYAKENTGLIIGDLLSQLFSNIYMNEFDLFVKHKLKFKHYCRYVDDSRIIDIDKNKLNKTIPIAELFLTQNLKLNLNMLKTLLTSTNKRLDFLGATIMQNNRYAVKRTLKNFSSRIRYMENYPEVEVLNSYLGYLLHFKTSKTKGNVLDTLSNIFDFGNNYYKAIPK